MESETELSGESLTLLNHLNAVKEHLTDDKICTNLGADTSFVGSVILALTKPEVQIVQTALLMMYRLCEFDECRKTFFAVDGENNKGLNKTLRSLMASGPLVIQELANSVYDQMENPECHHKQNALATPKKSRRENKRRRNSFFLGSVSDAKTVVLQIRGMVNRDDVDLLRQQLARVKGIISIMVQDKMCRVTLKTKQNLKPQVIADAIRATMTMTAEQVVKDESGIEKFISFKCPIPEDQMPDYPSDDDSPVKGDKNLEIPGKSDKKKNPSALWGMLNSVANFVNDQVYWY